MPGSDLEPNGSLLEMLENPDLTGGQKSGEETSDGP
jgi:hypothetical protein